MNAEAGCEGTVGQVSSMSAGRPRISIGLPVYNGEAQIEATLDSLLQQDLREFELIITDNASTDATAGICRRYAARDSRIRFYQNERNVGAAANYNRAFRLSRAPLFKWAPHDDLYASSYLQRCVSYLETSPSRVVLCYPKTRLIDEQGAELGEFEDSMDIRDAAGPQRLARLMRDSTNWCHPVVGVIRADVLRTTRLIGGHAGADHVLLAELVLRGEFHELPERLFYRRIHRGQSPSLQANSTPEERAAWFDGGEEERITLPRLRLLFEHLQAIRQAPLSRKERWSCYRLLRHAPFAEHWSMRLLLDEGRRALRKATWERFVLSGVRHAKYHFLPHRLWALLSGLERLEWARIRLALSPPSRATHAALLEFVADCLNQRSDPQSRAILHEWLSSGFEPCRFAAARCLQGRGGWGG